jgi:tetraacyldisaccharide 4'-kinase
VAADGRYAIGKQALADRSVDAVAAGLRAAAKAGSDSVVIISADARPHQAVVTVMEAARRAGLSQITFATQTSAGAALNLAHAALDAPLRRRVARRPSPITRRHLRPRLSATRQQRWRQCPRAAWLRLWQRRGALAWALWPLSLLYGTGRPPAPQRAAHAGHAGAHRGRQCDCRGGQDAGHPGRGRPPAQWLAPGIISRGYGRSTQDCRAVLPQPPEDVGDEPLLLARSTGVPVFVAPQRLDAARAAHGPSGGRHPGVRRRPAAHGPGARCGNLRLPRWRHRQRLAAARRPAARALARPVDAWCCTPARRRGHPAQPAGVRHATPAGALRPALRRPPCAAGTAGTARCTPWLPWPGPELFAMLQDQGLQLAQAQALPDHYDFESWQRPADPDALICTEKDAVKLWPLQPDAWPCRWSWTFHRLF